jgi:hypothetical protein
MMKAGWWPLWREAGGGAGGGGMDLGTLGPGGERADGLGVYSLRSGSGKG